jgi:hypothetical protein
MLENLEQKLKNWHKNISNLFISLFFISYMYLINNKRSY